MVLLLEASALFSIGVWLLQSLWVFRENITILFCYIRAPQGCVARPPESTGVIQYTKVSHVFEYLRCFPERCCFPCRHTPTFGSSDPARAPVLGVGSLVYSDPRCREGRTWRRHPHSGTVACTRVWTTDPPRTSRPSVRSRACFALGEVTRGDFDHSYNKQINKSFGGYLLLWKIQILIISLAIKHIRK